jgi:lysozyme
MRVGQKGLDLIKEFEGFRDKVYSDLAGYPTIGYGHRLTASDQFNDRFSPGITEIEAEELLRADAKTAENAVNKMVVEGCPVQLTQNQFDALVCWTYNLGAGSLAGSTMLQRLREGALETVPDEMVRWCKATDQKTGERVIVAGLQRRRAAEAELWCEPD